MATRYENMYDYVCNTGEFVSAIFFLLADGWFNVALLVNTRVPATDTQMKMPLCGVNSGPLQSMTLRFQFLVVPAIP